MLWFLFTFGGWILLGSMIYISKRSKKNLPGDVYDTLMTKLPDSGKKAVREYFNKCMGK